MKRGAAVWSWRRRVLCCSLLPGLMLLAGSAWAQSSGPTRINFDERLIKGQTAKAGSVYIFERQEIASRSLVEVRRHLRAKIIRTVFEEQSAR